MTPDRPQVVIVGAGVAGYQAALTLSREVGGVSEVAQASTISAHSVGFHNAGQALHLRDHIRRQLSLAAASTDPFERAACCTFVVLGGGYAGTAAASAGQSLSQSIARRCSRLRRQPIRWILADPAERLLPDMRHRLSRTTARVLRSRGVEVRTRTSIGQLTSRGLRLTDGEFIPTRTIVWSFGVRPDPLVVTLGLAVEQGRIRVDEHLAVLGVPDVYACGDVAAVPDPTRRGRIAPMSGRHALCQGRLAAANVAASLGHGSRRPYRHRIQDSIADLIRTPE